MSDPREAAETIAEMTADLLEIAIRARFRDLAFLLAMAEHEAREQAIKAKPAAPDPASQH